MSGTSIDDLRRLHFVNALFAHITGRDLFLAHQIKAAIAFSLAEFEAQPAARYDAAFNAAAARLLERFCRHRPRHGFFHWDAAHTLHSATPLFARSEIMAGLKQLAPYRESTFLITNLRPAVIPPDRRATERRRREYDEILSYIRELAAARAVRTHDLQLLFL
jgi:hypothetical protein